MRDGVWSRVATDMFDTCGWSRACAAATTATTTAPAPARVASGYDDEDQGAPSRLGFLALVTTDLADAWTTEYRKRASVWLRTRFSTLPERRSRARPGLLPHAGPKADGWPTEDPLLSMLSLSEPRFRSAQSNGPCRSALHCRSTATRTQRRLDSATVASRRSWRTKRSERTGLRTKPHRLGRRGRGDFGGWSTSPPPTCHRRCFSFVFRAARRGSGSSEYGRQGDRNVRVDVAMCPVEARPAREAVGTRTPIVRRGRRVLCASGALCDRSTCFQPGGMQRSRRATRL